MGEVQFAEHLTPASFGCGIAERSISSVEDYQRYNSEEDYSLYSNSLCNETDLKRKS